MTFGKEIPSRANATNQSTESEIGIKIDGDFGLEVVSLNKDEQKEQKNEENDQANQENSLGTD